MVFGEKPLLRFLKSVAHAQAVSNNTRVIWREYREDTFLNVLYTVLPFGAPGWVEVDDGNLDQILEQAGKGYQELQEEFFERMVRGGKSVARFLKAQSVRRQSALEAVRDARRFVSNLNAEIEAETRKHVARQVAIKAGATLVLSTAGLGAAALPAFAIGLGYNATLNLIKNLDQADNAVLVGLASDSWDATWKSQVEKAADGLGASYRNEAMTHAQKMSWLARRVAQQEQQIAEMTARQLAKHAKDARKLARTQQALGAARTGALVTSSVKYGFFAWDVFATVSTASDEFKALGYDGVGDGLSGMF